MIHLAWGNHFLVTSVGDRRAICCQVLLKFKYVVPVEQSFKLAVVDCWNSSLFVWLLTHPWWDTLYLLFRPSQGEPIVAASQEWCVLDALVASRNCSRDDWYKLIISNSGGFDWTKPHCFSLLIGRFPCKIFGVLLCAFLDIYYYCYFFRLWFWCLELLLPI